MAGLNEHVTASDRVQVSMGKARRVECVSCRRTVYYLREQKDGTHGFAPTEQQPVVRSDLICPVCGGLLCAYMDGQPMIRTDGGWV